MAAAAVETTAVTEVVPPRDGCASPSSGSSGEAGEDAAPSGLEATVAEGGGEEDEGEGEKVGATASSPQTTPPVPPGIGAVSQQRSTTGTPAVKDAVSRRDARDSPARSSTEALAKKPVFTKAEAVAMADKLTASARALEAELHAAEQILEAQARRWRGGAAAAAHLSEGAAEEERTDAVHGSREEEEKVLGAKKANLAQTEESEKITDGPEAPGEEDGARSVAVVESSGTTMQKTNLVVRSRVNRQEAGVQCEIAGERRDEKLSLVS